MKLLEVCHILSVITSLEFSQAFVVSQVILIPMILYLVLAFCKVFP